MEGLRTRGVKEETVLLPLEPTRPPSRCPPTPGYMEGGERHRKLVETPTGLIVQVTS